MKKFTNMLILFGLLFSGISSYNFQIKDNYTGDWSFEAPDAPEGSTAGKIVIQANAVIMSFDEDQEYPSSWVRVRNDSIIYQTDFDQATVLFSLKVNDESNMTGKAVWSHGETAIVLKKLIKGVKL